jgi:signal transduction histidine kinase
MSIDSRNNLKLLKGVDKITKTNSKIDDLINYKQSTSNYDVLVISINEMDNVIESLNSDLKIENMKSSEITQNLNEVTKKFNDKKELIEYYKSLKANMNNSIAYLLEVEEYITKNSITEYKDINLFIKKITYSYMNETILYENLNQFKTTAKRLVDIKQIDTSEDSHNLLSLYYTGIHFNMLINNLKQLKKDLEKINSINLKNDIDNLKNSIITSIENTKKTNMMILFIIVVLAIVIFFAFVFYYFREVKNRIKILKLTDSLKKANETLEQKVQMRTQELYSAFDSIKDQKEELEATLVSLKQTQEQLVESEKLAALGQLVAGVAHEINTPIGAIKSSSGNIIDSIESTLKNLPKISKLLSPTEEELFFDLISQSMTSKKSLLSTREERQYKKEIAKELEKIGIEDERVLATKLLKLKIFDNFIKYKELLEHSDRDYIFDSAYKISDIIINTQNINNAVDRASKIVFSLKSFARVNHSDDMILDSLETNLETVLTIYHNQIKQGTELIRDFKPLPDIYCYADELNQVWTNLIHNALQAMDNRGILTIKLYDDESHQIVSIKDTGCGISDSIKDKIFKPFFTTKKAGEGSGLGLDIINKIVTRHGGKIEVNSKENEGSEFVVYIPKKCEL